MQRAMIQDPFRRHALIVLVLVALALLLWGSVTAQEYFSAGLDYTRTIIESRPVLSQVVFVGMAAVSSILLFFSSVALVPLAVNAWGPGYTLLLLMIGWFVGANLAYCIGRWFGRRVTEYFVAADTLDRYGHLMSSKLKISEVALLKLALPSEMPSFALGIVRYPIAKLTIVLLASELPFALWAVYLSVALISEQRAVFVAVLVAGFVLLGLMTRRIINRMR